MAFASDVRASSRMSWTTVMTPPVRLEDTTALLHG
jgi:hypothetical protein